MDDITFCLSDCQRTDCYRHPSNIQDRTIPHSYAEFKGTETCPFAKDINVTINDDTISRKTVIDALWKAMYEYEDKMEKQFIESDDLDIEDWIQHRIFVQNMSDIDRQTILNLPSVQPESHREWYMHGYRDAQNAAMHESCTDCPLYDHDRHSCPRFNKVIPTAIRDAQTGDVAMDIATIIENEKDMRVILANGQTGWIPVTEELPEEDVEVLISYRYKEGEGDTSHTDIDITSYGQMYFGGNKVGNHKHWRAPFEYFESNYEVVAWMPLPPSYKEDEDARN